MTTPFITKGSQSLKFSLCRSDDARMSAAAPRRSSLLKKTWSGCASTWMEIIPRSHLPLGNSTLSPGRWLWESDRVMLCYIKTCTYCATASVESFFKHNFLVKRGGCRTATTCRISGQVTLTVDFLLPANNLQSLEKFIWDEVIG